MLSVLAKEGTSTRTLIEAAGLEPLELERRASVNTLFSLWRVIVSRFGPSVPWQVAAHARLADYGVFGFVVQTACSARTAIEAACQLFGLICGGPRFSLDAQGRLRANEPRPAGVGEAAAREAMFAHFARLSVEAVPGLRISQVELTRSLRLGEPHLLNTAPVRGNCREEAIVFDPTTLSRPATHAHPSLHIHLKAEAEKTLTISAPKTDPIETIRALVRERIQDPPGFSELAARLGASPRSLRRRLSARETSFREILDGVRRDVAEYAVERTNLPLSEIAYDVGFSEQSALSRAYRRWFGCPPNEARNRLENVR